jgi:hypothetical protein
LVEASEE